MICFDPDKYNGNNDLEKIKNYIDKCRYTKAARKYLIHYAIWETRYNNFSESIITAYSPIKKSGGWELWSLFDISGIKFNKNENDGCDIVFKSWKGDYSSTRVEYFRIGTPGLTDLFPGEDRKSLSGEIWTRG